MVFDILALDKYLWRAIMKNEQEGSVNVSGITATVFLILMCLYYLMQAILGE